jgi:predicted nucleic acid-binding protein
MSLFMLHTDIAADLIQGKSPALDIRIASTVPQELCISAVTRGELLCGLSRQMLQKSRELKPEETVHEEEMAGTSVSKKPSLLEKTPRSKASPIDQSTAESLRKITHAALAALTPHEAKVLRKRFGIDMIDMSTDHTLEKIDKQFDITRDRIRLQERAHLSSLTTPATLSFPSVPSARVLDQFFTRVRCLPWDEVAATHFASIAIELHRSAIPLGSMDTMIAGHAIAVGAVLVTSNESHFVRIPGLSVENWTAG